MAGGEIFNKTGIVRNLSGIHSGEFTGQHGGPRDDKMLVINSKYLYQAPWSFGGNWNKIKIGGFLSYTTAGNPNAGVTSDDIINSGNTSNSTFTWIGVGVNAQTKTLPLDAANQGFIGYMCNQIEPSISSLTTSSYTYTRRSVLELSTIAGTTAGTNRGQASGIATVGENILGGSVIRAGEFDHAFASSVDVTEFPNNGSIQVPLISAQKLAETTTNNSSRGVICPDDNGSELGGGNPRKEENRYFAFFGMQFEVVNKGTSSQRIKMNMLRTGQVINSNYSTMSNFTASNLETLFDDETKGIICPINERVTGIDGSADPGLRTMTGLPWTGTDGLALDLPDSFMFYNAFTTIRPRLSCWGVKKIS
jgi:hypothetical protein